MLTFHFTNIFILLPVYKNQCMCIYILITKLTCQFVENFPASFYSQFEQVFQCTEIKYTQILKNGQFGLRKFMQYVNKCHFYIFTLYVTRSSPSSDKGTSKPWVLLTAWKDTGICIHVKWLLSLPGTQANLCKLHKHLNPTSPNLCVKLNSQN